MKELRRKINRHGKHEVTVEIESTETLMSFRDEGFYRLGGQVEDVVAGHVITEAEGVYWCSIEQRWLA